MEPQDVTLAQITWWQVCHRRYYITGDLTFKLSESMVKADSIRWILSRAHRPAHAEGEYPRFIEDWREVARWTFRLVESLTEHQITIPQNIPSGINSWEAVRTLLQKEAQEALQRHLDDGECWDDENNKVVSWVLEVCTPFHVWCAYQRVRDDVDEYVTESLGDLVAGEKSNLEGTVDEVFKSLIRGIESHLGV